MTCLSPEIIAEIKAAPADESYYAMARQLGVSCTSVHKYRDSPSPRSKLSLVYLGPIALAFEESDITASEVARRLGWSCTRASDPKSGWDTTRVMRQLGLQSTRKKGSISKYRKYCTYDRALELCKALDLDPAEAGF